MRVALLAVAAAVTCCAAQPLPVLTPDIAQQMSLMELCEGTVLFRPENATTAVSEVQRRGADCAPFYPAIQARIQARNAAQPQPQFQQQPLIPPLTYQPIPVPPLPRQPTRCTTYRFGDELHTTCN